MHGEPDSHLWAGCGVGRRIAGASQLRLNLNLYDTLLAGWLGLIGNVESCSDYRVASLTSTPLGPVVPSNSIPSRKMSCVTFASPSNSIERKYVETTIGQLSEYECYVS